MPQDRSSGAKADKWGRATAQMIANRLGTEMISLKSNECIWNGKRIVIKCAGLNTNDVGVSFKMLERIDEICGAFQTGEHAFRLWTIKPEIYKSYMRDTASQGASRGKVGLVNRQLFEERGSYLGEISCQ